MSESDHEVREADSATTEPQLTGNSSEQEIREAYVDVLKNMGASDALIEAAQQAATESHDSEAASTAS